MVRKASLKKSTLGLSPEGSENCEPCGYLVEDRPMQREWPVQRLCVRSVPVWDMLRLKGLLYIQMEMPTGSLNGPT